MLHPRKPTAQEVAAAPIDRYSLTQLQAVPIGHDGALATYIAVVVIGSGGSPVTVKFAVGEVWVKQAGEWKCRYDQATILK
jgi:ketosteroid isomerase-like protein